MASIVVVEDDLRIREMVSRVLADQGHDVESAGTAMAGLERIVKGVTDLVILDLGLPDLDGGELLTMVRAVSDVPIVVVTARSGDAEVIRILDAGADDYLVKPFTSGQLAARVRAVLRRGTGTTPEGPTVVGGLTLDRSAREAMLDGNPLDLSPKEFDMLFYLASHAGEVITKRDLLAEVWREPYGGSEGTIDVHLSWLRKKLGESAAEPRYLRTVYGVGVKLIDPEP
ncbi:response regulator transcription factor [bacterium]|nr:response regulator transcription factor [bacterium]